MPYSCCAVGCRNKRGVQPGVILYRFPVDQHRRQLWINALRRADWAPKEHSRLCNFHFASGKQNRNPLSPDYVPTLFSYTPESVKSQTQGKLKNFQRRQLFKLKRENCNKYIDTINEIELVQNHKTCNVSVQTDLIASRPTDNSFTMPHIKHPSENVIHLTHNEESFYNNNEKVKYFTGLPSFCIMMTIFNFINPYISSCANSKLSNFNMFLLTCMRLRLNLNVQFLAYYFNVSSTTTSRIFLNIINIMYHRLASTLIVWPERDILRASMPMCFRAKFSKCVSIIDCFEVFIERSSDLMARAQTYSQYKSHNTIKFLISITPQGTISYISKGWGGRASDKYIVENSGFLNKLLPGDLILADRGFDVSDSVGLYAATIKTPAFTKGKNQLDAIEVEETRGLASVRIHVERVIGLVRQKYTMLGSTIPIKLLVADDTGLTTFDKIVQVSCALSNLSEPIVPFE